MSKIKFEKNHYLVIKEAIEPKVAEFVYNYFLMKRQVARTFFDTRFISPFTTEWGVWNDEQVPNTYSHYADTAMETLLLNVQPKMEKLTGLKLNPTYSYARIYKKGDVLHRHKDRFSCEISTTMNLKPGDMLVYKGMILEHWRDVFLGDNCAQVFLHYNNKDSKDADKNIFDNRPHLGLPSFYKGVKIGS